MSSPWAPTWAHHTVRAVLAAVVVVSAAGCGAFSMGGSGLPTLSTDRLPDGQLEAFRGVLEVGPQGCLMVRLTEPSGDTADRWTVWPPGTDLVVGSVEAGNGARVDGQTFAGEDPVTGTGRLVDLAEIPGGEEGGGYFRSSGQYCDALVGGVLVIDDVQHA